jgi:hypothetical protein
MSNTEDFDFEMQNRLGQMAGPQGMAEQVSYMVYGAAVTTTRAFDKVTLKINPDINRIFVAIQLRWFAKYKKMKPFRDGWLSRAQAKCQEHAPTGWKVLCYYEGFKEEDGK